MIKTLTTKQNDLVCLVVQCPTVYCEVQVKDRRYYEVFSTTSDSQKKKKKRQISDVELERSQNKAFIHSL